jgi:aminopeptidase N
MLGRQDGSDARAAPCVCRRAGLHDVAGAGLLQAVEAPACEVLSSASDSLSLDGCSSWLFANVDSRGYYRTAYGSGDLKALGDAVRSSQLTPVEQTSLLEDAWTLVGLREADIAGFLRLAGDIVKAPMSPVIVSATRRINYVSDYLVGDAERPAFERWVRQLLKPTADKLGWMPAPRENAERREIRAAVLYTLGYAGRDPEVLREARRRIDGYLASGGVFDPTVFDAVVQLAALNGDAALYEKYLQRSRMRETSGQRSEDAFSFRNGLAYFQDPSLRRRTLEYATSPDVRSQDAPGLIAGLLRRPWAAADTWEHVKTSWDALQSTGMFQGVRALVSATQNFCDEAARNDVDRFFQTHHIGGNERRAREALETIDACIATRSYQAKNLSGFLSDAGATP